MDNFFINDIFWTVQGEGTHAGRRALFIRMPKCNLACSWCDTEFDTFEKMSRIEIEKYIHEEPTKFAVITGGEPLMNRQVPQLRELLRLHQFEVAFETNGTFAPHDSIQNDFITCSPKADAEYKINDRLYYYVSEWKYVVDSDFDFDILSRHDKDPRFMSHRLSPEFSNMETNVQRILEYMREKPRWKLNLQTHKWINVP